MSKRDKVERGLPKPSGLPEPAPAPAASGPAEEYAVAATRLEARQFAERQALAGELGPALRKHAEGMPQATYAGKKTLVRWVNAELRRFGVAIRCPKTGCASAMVADRGDDPAPAGSSFTIWTWKASSSVR